MVLSSFFLGEKPDAQGLGSSVSYLCGQNQEEGTRLACKHPSGLSVCEGGWFTPRRLAYAHTWVDASNSSADRRDSLAVFLSALALSNRVATH